MCGLIDFVYVFRHGAAAGVSLLVMTKSNRYTRRRAFFATLLTFYVSEEKKEEGETKEEVITTEIPMVRRTREEILALAITLRL